MSDDNTIILRLDKKGCIYNASCSANGRNFESIGTADVSLSNINAGVIVCNGVMPEMSRNFPSFPGMQQQPAEEEVEFEVSYDYFHIKSSGLK